MGWSPGAAGIGSIGLDGLSFYPVAEVLPAKAVGQTCPQFSIDSATIGALNSGFVLASSIYLPAAKTIHSITYFSGTTALVTGTHQVFGLYDQALNLLATTVDDLAAAWAVNTAKTLALTADFETAYDGLYYLAILVAATTVPTLLGETVPNTISNVSPFFSARYNGGVTALPASLVFSAAVAGKPYALVSSP